MRPALFLLTGIAAALAAPLAAKDSLGIFGEWGAFRDPKEPRCYAISASEERRGRRDYKAYASVGTWPERSIRGQVHFRLSLAQRSGAQVRLRVGNRSFNLTGGGGDAWAADPRQDAAIIAAMRQATRMSLSSRDLRGNAFTDSYSLEGAATAIDAAAVGCTRRG